MGLYRNIHTGKVGYFVGLTNDPQCELKFIDNIHNLSSEKMPYNTNMFKIPPLENCLFRQDQGVYEDTFFSEIY